MKSLQNLIEKTNKKITTSEKLSALKNNKNLFQRCFSNIQILYYFDLIKKFHNNELNPEGMISLKKSLQNIKMPDLFSKEDKLTIQNVFSYPHESYLIGYIDNEPEDGLLKKDVKSDFYFLKRNIEQEQRYRKSFKVLIKYTCRRIDSEYNKQ